MHFESKGPGAIRGFAFKDATPDRPSPASSARRKSNNKEPPRLKALPGRRVFPSEGGSDGITRPLSARANAQIERAIERGAEQLIVNSGELLAAVGGRPVLKIKCGIAAT